MVILAGFIGKLHGKVQLCSLQQLVHALCFQVWNMCLLSPHNRLRASCMQTYVHNMQATTLHILGELTLTSFCCGPQEGDALRVLRLPAPRLEVHPHAAMRCKRSGCHERELRRSDVQL